MAKARGKRSKVSKSSRLKITKSTRKSVKKPAKKKYIREEGGPMKTKPKVKMNASFVDQHPLVSGKITKAAELRSKGWEWTKEAASATWEGTKRAITATAEVEKGVLSAIKPVPKEEKAAFSAIAAVNESSGVINFKSQEVSTGEGYSGGWGGSKVQLRSVEFKEPIAGIKEIKETTQRNVEDKGIAYVNAGQLEEKVRDLITRENPSIKETHNIEIRIANEKMDIALVPKTKA